MVRMWPRRDNKGGKKTQKQQGENRGWGGHEKAKYVNIFEIEAARDRFTPQKSLNDRLTCRAVYVDR